MLCIQDQKYFDEVVKFAESIGMKEQLQSRLDFLRQANTPKLHWARNLVCQIVQYAMW